jgi:dTDP-4-amino-4,6-dideoxygalactose transaminase
VFCDVAITDGLVSSSEWARARALGANVALVVHLYGNPARVDEVRSIFPSPECLVVDDAAQALGSFSVAGLAGALGDAGLLSRQRPKRRGLL